MYPAVRRIINGAKNLVPATRVTYVKKETTVPSSSFKKVGNGSMASSTPNYKVPKTPKNSGIGWN